MKTVQDVGTCFNERVMSLTKDYNEIIVTFDTYKKESLKNNIREKRRHGKDPVQYHLADDTNIQHIPLSRFLSHDQTKSDLAMYLAKGTLQHNMHSSKCVIVSASGKTSSNMQMQFDDNNHEEAGTLMIHLAIDSSSRNPPDSTITFFSPDTDVFILVLANYHCLVKDTFVSLASGVVEIRPIWENLGIQRAQAIPAFHVFSGADNTGKFAQIGKATWFKLFL